jgi:hypothetical protein
MKVDDKWSAREPRELSWWGHRLAQHVWAEPARSSHDHEVVRVHATTALLRDVPDTPEMRARLATLNRFVSLGAFVWLPERRRIVLRCAACFHAGNLAWLQPLFLAAVGIQAADAHIKVDGLADLLGGKPDASAHPRSGPRPEPDDMLNVIAAVFAPGGAGPSPWTGADFKAAADMTPRPWVLATADDAGLTAEYPLARDLPAVAGKGPETALFTASSTDRHPQLGGGLLLRLQLPFPFTESHGSEVACNLNALETAGDRNTHTLGAWCVGPAGPGPTARQSVTFVSFIPAAAYRKGLLQVLAVEMALRTRWIASVLPGDNAPGQRMRNDVDTAVRSSAHPARLGELRRAAAVGAEVMRSEASQNAAEAADTSQLWQTGPGESKVQCSACRAPLQVTAESRGTKVLCPRCGTKQALPR